MSNPGPCVHGPWIVFPIFTWWATMPLFFGKSPVPMLAWSCAVLVGEEPTVALEYHAPCGIIFFSTGQEFGHRLRTSMPPASHTSVTRSFGGVVRLDAGTSASDIGLPSSDWNGKLSSC